MQKTAFRFIWNYLKKFKYALLMIVVMAIMTLPAVFKGKLRRWQGITLLSIYAAFVVLQVLIAVGAF